MENLKWTALKKIHEDTRCPLYIKHEDSDYVYVFIILDSVSFETAVKKDTEEYTELTLLLSKIDFGYDDFGRKISVLSPFADSVGFRFRGSSFKTTIPTNTTIDYDYKIEDERWINGGYLIVDNIGPDDAVTFQIVDKDNLIGYGAGVVLDEFIQNFYIPEAGNLEVDLAYPARLISGLYIRLRYTSTHTLGCTVKCNLYLHMKA